MLTTFNRLAPLIATEPSSEMEKLLPPEVDQVGSGRNDMSQRKLATRPKGTDEIQEIRDEVI